MSVSKQQPPLILESYTYIIPISKDILIAAHTDVQTVGL
jgi:hypothetical protein